MEDLYDDLENYNEVCSVEELRNENKDLKLKLEEYATAMGKLQKSLLQDYDKLSMEFNKLQMNYSSLLKTARAEVERKSQMITQLNLEKDMFMLQALQNGNRLRSNRNNFQSGAQNPKKATNVDAAGKAKTNTNDKNVQLQKSSDVRSERCETSSVSTNVSIPTSENTKLLNIVDNVVEKVEACINKGELKENIPLSKPEQRSAPKIHASSIKNRRKSMPAVSYPTFSSDDECEPEKPTKQMTRNEPINRNINSVLMRISNERMSNKTSETSSMDDRSSIHQDSVTEGYRSRINRHSDTDKQKMGDRCRETDRFKRFDKFRNTDRHKESDKYKEADRYRDSDKVRETGRVRESDRHREIDRYKESDKYRDSENYREGDKYRDSNRYRELDKNREKDRWRGKDRYDTAQRHKRHYSPERPIDRFKRSFKDYQDDHNRPDHGRPRIIESPSSEGHNYHSRGQEQWSHSERNSHESEKYKTRCEERFVGKYPTPTDHDGPSSKRQRIETETQLDVNKRHHEEPSARGSRIEALEYDMLRASCQSPDAAFSPEPHTEAVHTDTVKEIRSTAIAPLEDPRTSSNKYVLKTENGRTTLSTAVSNSISIKPVDKSLWNIESVVVPDALLNKPQHHLDDDQIKNIYMEIDNPEINVSVESGEICSSDTDLVNDNDGNKIASSQHNNTKKHLPEIMIPQIQSQETVPKQSYRIPKVKQSNAKTHTDLPHATHDLPKIKSEVVVVKVPKERQSSVNRQSLLQIENHDHFKPAKNINKMTPEVKKDEKRRITLSDIAMVHDDLELSDENSDNAEFQKHAQVAQEVVHTTKPSTGTKVDETVNQNKSSFQIISKENADKNCANVIADDDKPEDPEGQKKQRSKRRKTKSKEIELGESNTAVQVTEKKVKSKKDKEKPKEIKQKFTDLFGESSSLITPEDLGIPGTCVPLCEDAEDAVDINIKEIVKVPPSKLNAAAIITNINRDETQTTSRSTNLDDANTEDKEIAKRIEEQIVNSEGDSNTVYQNLNSETQINKPDVVKTVIISSGLQPQFVVDNREGTTEKRIADVEVNIQNIAESSQLPAGLLKQNYIQALATSTPHKDFPTPQVAAIDSKAADCSSSCNDSKSESVDVVGRSMDQSDTNTQDSHDAPDVRIFVRRRRKGVKRT